MTYYSGLAIVPGYIDDSGDKCVIYLELKTSMRPEEWDIFKDSELCHKLENRLELIENYLYADKILYSVTVSFYLKASEWSEFEDEPLFQELASYCASLHHETECMHTVHYVPECREETRVSEARFCHCRLKLWFDRMRRKFHRT